MSAMEDEKEQTSKTRLNQPTGRQTHNRKVYTHLLSEIPPPTVAMYPHIPLLGPVMPRNPFPLLVYSRTDLQLLFSSNTW